MYCGLLLQTPRSTPIPALHWDCGVLPMESRVSQKQLNFLKHILCLSDDTLAKQVLNTQRDFNLPGFATLATNLMKELELPNLFEDKVNQELSKKKWKSTVKEAIQNNVECKLRENIKSFKKLKSGPMNGESYSPKEYIKSMTLEDARMNFKIRSQMLEVKYNYSHDPRFTKDLWKCDSCESAIDTQSHILWCPSYSELRAGKDINNDEDLINYIKNVMKTRQKLHITK